MSTPSDDGLKLEIDAGKMKVGNTIVDANGFPVTASMPIYSDSTSSLAVGSPLPLFTGIANTGVALLALRGSATGSANDLMHLTLVSGANATATIAGYYRVTVTDDAGVVTTGSYYAPFYTLA